MIAVSTSNVPFEMAHHLTQPAGGFIIPLYNDKTEPVEAKEDLMMYQCVIAYNGSHHYAATKIEEPQKIEKFLLSVAVDSLDVAKFYANRAAR